MTHGTGRNRPAKDLVLNFPSFEAENEDCNKKSVGNTNAFESSAVFLELVTGVNPLWFGNLFLLKQMRNEKKSCEPFLEKQV